MGQRSRSDHPSNGTTPRRALARVGYRQCRRRRKLETDAVLIREPHRHGSRDAIPGDIHGGTPALHRQALIGAGRALTNQQLDWQYVTTNELRDGLAACYDSLLLPWHRALDPTLLPILEEYVAAGGRLIVDCQFAFCDQAGRLFARGEQSTLASLFGAWTEVVHDGRTGGAQWQGQAITGFWADISVSDAETIARFDDGRPAITRKKHGAGEAILLAFDPTSAAITPHQDAAETLIGQLCRTAPAEWSSTLSQTIRRVTDQADHYYFINPGPATTAWVHSQTSYQSVCDVLENNRSVPQISGGFAVSIPEQTAMWIRAVK